MAYKAPEFLFGYKLLQDHNMVMDGEPYKIPRDWKERLFSWPWCPWLSTRYVTDKVYSTEIIEFENYLVMHPELAKAIIENDVPGTEESNEESIQKEI